MDWTEKYRPSTLDGIVGNPAAVNSLRAWARSWEDGVPDLRAAVLMGPPGVGKTTSAEALAREMGWGIVEMNASDQRKGSAIEDIAIRGSQFDTFGDDGSFLSSGSGGRKLIVLDEADNFFGNNDRGAMPAVNKLITTTRQPVILIVNDFYALSRKSSVVKTRTLQIQFKRPQASTMAKALNRIAEAEGVDVPPEAMQRIAENASGDMRAAVRNLESLAIGADTVTEEMSEQLSRRDSRTDLFAMLTAVYRSGDPSRARRAVSEVDEEPKTKMMWIDENLPTEYSDPGDMVRGFDKLSKSAVFLGRTQRRQYFGFWSYASDCMSFCVASARMSSRPSHDRLRFPGYLGRMSRSRGVRLTKASLELKLAAYMHCTTGRIERDVLPYLVQIVHDRGALVGLVSEAGLDEDEVALLTGAKATSKQLKTVMEEAAALTADRLDAMRAHIQDEPVRIDAPAPRAPSAPAPEPGQPKQKEAKPLPRSQRSLFDFRG